MVTPKKLTQAQAARAAGVTRTQIHRVLKAGKLSGERLDDGTVVIDPSELLRVYPAADLKQTQATGNRRDRDAASVTVKRSDPSVFQDLVAELRQQRDRLQADLDRERSDRTAEREAATAERTRLLRVVEQQADQMKLLTDQRTEAEKQTRADAEGRGFWSRLFGKR